MKNHWLKKVKKEKTEVEHGKLLAMSGPNELCRIVSKYGKDVHYRRTANSHSCSAKNWVGLTFYGSEEYTQMQIAHDLLSFMNHKNMIGAESKKEATPLSDIIITVKINYVYENEESIDVDRVHCYRLSGIRGQACVIGHGMTCLTLYYDDVIDRDVWKIT